MTVQIQEVKGVRYAKVRIPIAINEAGEWIADGLWSRDYDEAKTEVENTAAECAYGNVTTHFVYAVVPVPCGLIISGELETDN